MEFRKLIKNTSYLVTTRFAQFIVGIFRSKINALILGAEGVGIVNQFSMLLSQSSSFTTLGMSEAVVKQIAENDKENSSVQLIAASIKTYLITVLIFIFVSTTILFFFRFQITTYIFGSNDYLNFFYLAILSFPLLIVNGVFFAILKGFKGIKHIAIARMATVFSNFLIFLPLIFIYKLNGAVAYLPISYVVTIIWNFYFTNRFYLKPKELNLAIVLKAPVNKRFQKEMLTFSGFGLVISLISMSSVFIGRSIVVTDLGIEKIGIYSPILLFASLFTGFLLPSFNTYLYPRFSEVKSNFEAAGIINDALRLASLCLLPLILLGIPFRSILIETFYSKEFLEASNYLPFHFFGVIFNVWFVIFGQTMTPRGFIKQHSIFKFIYHAINIFLAVILIPIYGMYGYTMKFVIGYLFLFTVNYLFLRFKTEFKISFSNLKLMFFLCFSAIFLIILDFVFSMDKTGMFVGPILLIASYFLLNLREKKFLKEKLFFLIQKFR